jgi:hypothetical protein
MNADETKTGSHDRAELPAEVYAGRLRQLKLSQAADQNRERRLGYAKLAIAAMTLTLALLFLHYLRGLEALPLLMVLFLVLAVQQEKRIRRIRLRTREIEFFERGLARIADRWSATGESGERFLDPLHPYARDLDVFGPGSLFELLCTARTRAGEQTLAAWLLARAPVETLEARQKAVGELKGQLEFRVRLFCLGETVRLGVNPQALTEWGERQPVFDRRLTRVLTRSLSALWILSLIAWALGGSGELAGVVTLVNLAWAHRLYRRQDEAAEALEKAADGLGILSGILALLEAEQFTAPRLLELKAALAGDGVRPSAAIRRLKRLADYVSSRHNPFARLVDVFTFWSLQLVFSAERWQEEFGPAIRGWLKAVGELEALTALAGYAYEHPGDVFPVFVSPQAGSAPLFEAEAMAHPLLPPAQGVRNDIRLGDGLQLIVLSGPNMAGKSTFIRSVGVNAVLAQCGGPVRAAALRMTPLTVAASICVLDSLSGGVSRFYAEIHRVKLISDLASGPVPVLFLLDELLSGTNSHDRLVGSESIVRGLVERSAMGIVSTHDLALTRIPERMGSRAANFHFEDSFDGSELVFDYRMKPGVVKTSNALELMRSIGLGVRAPGEDGTTL